MTHTEQDQVVTTAATGPDARLLELFREWQAAKSREDEADEATADIATKAASALEFAIQEVPAQTIMGLAVKARVASQYVDEPEGRRLLDDIVHSLVQDALRLGAAQV
jgi:hypothetical protein